MDVFHYPDGKEFVLPTAWGVKQYVKDNPKRFRTYMFRSLAPGDAVNSETGIAPFTIPAGCKVEDKLLCQIERPERCCPMGHAWFVDKERLLSVLQAMIAGHPLPPIQVESAGSGSLRVTNGFHRYFASVILGFSEISVISVGSQRDLPLADVDEGRASNETVLLEEPKEDGSVTHVTALLLLPKPRGTLGAQRRPQAKAVACKPQRYEAPRVKRERLLREEHERMQRERKEHLLHEAAAFRKKAMSRQAITEERCQRMRRPPVTYSEKITGRMNVSAPPAWDAEPAL